MTFNAGIEAAALNLTTRDDLVSRLREQCNGHPHAKIAWPHRILHEAASAIEAKNAEIAMQYEEATTYHKFWIEERDKRIEAESRISDLERQLATETERCARVAERAGCGDAKCTGCYGNQIAAAIRGGAK